MKATVKMVVNLQICPTLTGISLPNCFFDTDFSRWDLISNNAPMVISATTPYNAVQNCAAASCLVYLAVMYRKYTMMLIRLNRMVSHFARFD